MLRVCVCVRECVPSCLPALHACVYSEGRLYRALPPTRGEKKRSGRAQGIAAGTSAYLITKQTTTGRLPSQDKRARLPRKGYY